MGKEPLPVVQGRPDKGKCADGHKAGHRAWPCRSGSQHPDGPACERELGDDAEVTQGTQQGCKQDFLAHAPREAKHGQDGLESAATRRIVVLLLRQPRVLSVVLFRPIASPCPHGHLILRRLRLPKVRQGNPRRVPLG